MVVDSAVDWGEVRKRKNKSENEFCGLEITRSHSHTDQFNNNYAISLERKNHPLITPFFIDGEVTALCCKSSDIKL